MCCFAPPADPRLTGLGDTEAEPQMFRGLPLVATCQFRVSDGMVGSNTRAGDLKAA